MTFFTKNMGAATIAQLPVEATRESSLLCAQRQPEEVISASITSPNAKKRKRDDTRIFKEHSQTPCPRSPSEKITSKQAPESREPWEARLKRISACFSRATLQFEEAGIDPQRYQHALLQEVEARLRFDNLKPAESKQPVDSHAVFNPCNDQTVLCRAVATGNLALVETAWRLQEISTRQTLLEVCLAAKHFDLCAELIDRGTDLTVFNSAGETYLVQAVKMYPDNYHCNRFVQLLLDHGANPNQPSQDGLCLVDHLIEEPKEIEILLEKGWKVPMFLRDQFLFDKVRTDAWRCLPESEHLIEQIHGQLGLLVNTPNAAGISPLCLAISRMLPPESSTSFAAQRLIELGADLSERDAEGRSVATRVLMTGDDWLFEEFLNHYTLPIPLEELPDNVFLPNSSDLRHQLLEHAVHHKQHEQIARLLQQPIGKRFSDYLSCFIEELISHTIFEDPDFKSAAILIRSKILPVEGEALEEGEDEALEEIVIEWNSILHKLIPIFFELPLQYAEKKVLMELLLEKGADLKTIPRHYIPNLLVIAMYLKNKTCLNLFIRGRAFLTNTMNDEGKTAYAIALEKRLKRIAEDLQNERTRVDPRLSPQAILDALTFPPTQKIKDFFLQCLPLISLNMQWQDKRFLEHLIIKTRESQESPEQWFYVTALLQHFRKDLDSVFIEGEPILLFSLKHHLKDLFECLITTGRCPVNKKGTEGMTPLLWVMLKTGNNPKEMTPEDINLLKRLIDYGADPLFGTKELGTPFALAKGQPELLRLLLRWPYHCALPEMHELAYQPLPSIKEFEPPASTNNPLVSIDATLPINLQRGLESLKKRLDDPAISRRAHLRFYVSCLLEESQKNEEKKIEILEMLSNLQDRCYGIEEEIEQNYWLYCIGVEISTPSDWIRFEAWRYRIRAVQEYCAKYTPDVHDANQLRQTIAATLGIPVRFKDISGSVSDDAVDRCFSTVALYYPHCLLRLLKEQIKAPTPAQDVRDTRLYLPGTQLLMRNLLIQELIPDLVAQKRVDGVCELIKRYQKGQKGPLEVMVPLLWPEFSTPEALLALGEEALQKAIREADPKHLDQLLDARGIASGPSFYDALAQTITDQQLYDYLMRTGWFEPKPPRTLDETVEIRLQHAILD